MKKALFAVTALACFATGVVVADDNVDAAKPIELTALQMDKVTAAGNLLPNGLEIFPGFDNAAPDDKFLGLHPGLYRMLVNSGFDLSIAPSEAAWEAHINSPVIDCSGCP